MNVVDVNVLLLSHRQDVDRHALWRGWLDSVREADEVVGVPGYSIAGFVRIVTNVRAFARPSTIDEAIGFVDALLDSTAIRRMEPGPGHWTVFSDLCRRASATGKLVPDAWLAALAIENRATLITADRGFVRYPGLKWRDPTADV